MAIGGFAAKGYDWWHEGRRFDVHHVVKPPYRITCYNLGDDPAPDLCFVLYFSEPTPVEAIHVERAPIPTGVTKSAAFGKVELPSTYAVVVRIPTIPQADRSIDKTTDPCTDCLAIRSDVPLLGWKVYFNGGTHSTQRVESAAAKLEEPQDADGAAIPTMAPFGQSGPRGVWK